MPPEQGNPSGLTDSQRELLKSAAREGYFEVPRKIPTVELAEKHGVSDREASKEIRRALDVVVSDAELGE